ncbi:Fur family peroxide stress response transcriptional regulator [Clostridiales Family XIII bacterium PM5-7]
MKNSKQRSLILNIVRENPVHPTAEWIYGQACKEMPSIGIATVYRNLNALVTLGEIEKIHIADGIDRFDGNTKEHYHLKCTSCGKLQDLDADSDALDNLHRTVGTTFAIDDSNIRLNTTLLKGVCNDCIHAEK